jgi:hypothetical protein
LYQNE